MSVFLDLLCEMLPLRSELQNEGNDLRKVLDRTIGEWMDNYSHPFDELFLSTATGGWLDAHGNDYGVPRRLDESDDDYRQRIIYEKLDELTAHLLMKSYNVQLYTYINRFNVVSNDMASDNPYITNMDYMAVVDDDTRIILNNKFIVDQFVYWADSLVTDKIIDVNNNNLINQYLGIYSKTNLYGYFRDDTSLKEVVLRLPNTMTIESLGKDCTNLISVDLDCSATTNMMSAFQGCSNLTNVNLNLPSVTKCTIAFYDCVSLTSLDLNLPSATNCIHMLGLCINLTNVTLNLPSLDDYSDMFSNCHKLEYINLTIPDSKVGGMISYITGLSLQYLETLIINGEEVDLS